MSTLLAFEGTDEHVGAFLDALVAALRGRGMENSVEMIEAARERGQLHLARVAEKDALIERLERVLKALSISANPTQLHWIVEALAAIKAHREGKC